MSGGKDGVRGRDLTARGLSAVSSDRSFGFVFASAFGVVALFPLVRGGGPRLWAVAVALLLLGVSLVRPEWLAPFNRVWFHVGRILHAVTSPVVMAAIYFGVVTPTGIIMRALKRDPLRLRRDPHAASYWLRREPPGPDPETMINQF